MISVDLTNSTAADRVACFGVEFRNIFMVSFEMLPNATMRTVVVLDGELVHLIGDPQRALRNVQAARAMTKASSKFRKFLARLISTTKQPSHRG